MERLPVVVAGRWNRHSSEYPETQGLFSAGRSYETREKHGFGGKDIGLGVLGVHNDRVETVDEIVAGVGRARKLFKPKQIWLTPDCGLKDRSKEVALAKLQAMSEAAEISREVLV